MNTIRITLDAVFQDGSPFNGFLSASLCHIVGTQAGVVIPIDGQEVEVHAGTGTIALVPNEVIGDDSYYRIQLYTKNADGTIASTYFSERVVVPAKNCNLSEIVSLRPNLTDDLTSHKQLRDRDAQEQHPIQAITGLRSNLASLTTDVHAAKTYCDGASDAEEHALASASLAAEQASYAERLVKGLHVTQESVVAIEQRVTKTAEHVKILASDASDDALYAKDSAQRAEESRIAAQLSEQQAAEHRAMTAGAQEQVDVSKKAAELAAAKTVAQVSVAATAATRAENSAALASAKAEQAVDSAEQAVLSCREAGASTASAARSASEAREEAVKSLSASEVAMDAAEQAGISATSASNAALKAALSEASAKKSADFCEALHIAIGDMPLANVSDGGKVLVADGEALAWVKGPVASGVPTPEAIPVSDVHGRLGSGWVSSHGDVKMWFGPLDETGAHPLVGELPDTCWRICDGAHGTPDMRSAQFITESGNIVYFVMYVE